MSNRATSHWMSNCSQVDDHLVFVAELGVVVGLMGIQIVGTFYLDVSGVISHSFNERRGVISRILQAMSRRL